MASVYLYVPNLIGYVRLLCIFICCLYFEEFTIMIPVYAFQAALDGIDGTAARCLNQASSFGAWFDVLIDNIGRSLLWSQVNKWCIFIACFEWTVFVCTHTIGLKWREAIDTAPFWVQKVMEKGFHTLTGTYVICGLHLLPLLLYSYCDIGVNIFLGNLRGILLILIIVLMPARILCAMVESWFVYIHLKMMEQSDENAKNTNTQNEE